MHMAFFSRKPAAVPARKPAIVAPAPPVAVAKRNRRQVSGDRVLCRCSLELPKHDPFSNYRASCEGFIVLNVRGGSLYLAHQFNEDSVRQAFPPDKASLIKDFKLYQKEGTPIPIGDLHVRFLKFKQGLELTGLVLRFVNLTDAQMDLLNGLTSHFPIVTGSEETAIPQDALHRM